MIGLLLAAQVVTCVRVPNPPSAVRQGAPSYLEACNVTPRGWRPMSAAPRDGTVIEIRNAYGTDPPSYSIERWAPLGGQMAWVSAAPRPPCRSDPPKITRDEDGTTISWGTISGACMTSSYDPSAEPGLAWRPFTGNVAAWCWRDHNPAYAHWIKGCGN